MSLRVVFMGTPDFAVPTLVEIVGQGHHVCAVYTREPKPAGRGLGVQLTPVQRQAQQFLIPVETPKTLRTAEAVETLRSYEPDVVVVVAYGLILPAAILEIPKLGCLNLHGSLLPRWRGAAPIHRAVMAGDAETGVMVMQMDEGLDTGPVGMAERTPILPDMTMSDVHDRLKGLGADLMARALGALSRGSLRFRPQDGAGVTYASKITKDEARIDWSQSAHKVHDHIRGLSLFPGAFFELDAPQDRVRVKVLRSSPADGHGRPGDVLDDRLTIACSDGAVRLDIVQRSGKGPMSASEFLRGNPVGVGTRVA